MRKKSLHKCPKIKVFSHSMPFTKKDPVKDFSLSQGHFFILFHILIFEIRLTSFFEIGFAP